MYFDVTEERALLRDSARDYLEARSPMRRVRELMATEQGFDPAMWDDMAQMGWTSIAVPEAFGGDGYGFGDLGVVIEELGRSLTPAPLLSTAVLGTGAFLLGATEGQCAAYLPDVAAGRRRATAAVSEPGRGWGPDGLDTELRRRDGGAALWGTKSYVLDGHTADLLVVSARDGDAVDLFVVDAAAGGVTCSPLQTMDLTRKQARVELHGAEPVARLGEKGSGGRTIERLYDLAAVMLAHEQVGGADRCLEMAVAYAKERVQFGRAIGSFQAVKHKCARMLVDVEAARSAALYAGAVIGAGGNEPGIAAALAKARCSDAFYDVAAETIQVFGGIGFTWEHDAHLYLKRAKTDQLLFGSPAEWRAKLGDRLGL